jgi:hypothetical protein
VAIVKILFREKIWLKGNLSTRANYFLIVSFM